MQKLTNKNTILNNNNIKSIIKSKQTRIKNWTNYNISLTERGLILQIAKDAVRQSKLSKHKLGHPEEYPDAIIKAMAIYREMFNLTLRATEGFARDIFSIFNTKVPSYATLQRRMSKLDINISIDKRRLKGGVTILPDSTGFKVTGEGEWKVRKHGKGKRRIWSKVHYLVDYNSLQILGVMLTGDYYGDNIALPSLLRQIPKDIEINTIIGDGAYGTRALYRLAEENYNATLISPPPKNAKPSKYQDWKTRDEYVEDCDRLGKDKWKEIIGYHRRSLAETNMFRVKSTFSDRLKSKTTRNQRVEVLIRVMLLNKWTNKYMPTYT